MYAGQEATVRTGHGTTDWFQIVKGVCQGYILSPCLFNLYAEYQKIARRDKKAFFSDQSKEIEENNRMGKTRDLFRKIRDTKGMFYAKMGTVQE